MNCGSNFSNIGPWIHRNSKTIITLPVDACYVTRCTPFVIDHICRLF